MCVAAAGLQFPLDYEHSPNLQSSLSATCMPLSCAHTVKTLIYFELKGHIVLLKKITEEWNSSIEILQHLCSPSPKQPLLIHLLSNGRKDSRVAMSDKN